MTKPTTTRSDDTEPTPRPRATYLAVALAALALLCAGAGLATAQSDGPAVSVTDAELSPSGTATVDVVLTAAPDGLSGYNIDLTVDDPDVAHVESASYPDRFDLTTDPEIGDAGRAVTLEAADVGATIDAGATGVTLATVEVAGDAPGEAELTVDLRQFDGNEGERLRPAARAGTLTVVGDSSASDAEAAAADGADSASSDGGSSAPTGPVAELGGSADGVSTGFLALAAALAALLAVSAGVVVRRRS